MVCTDIAARGLDFKGSIDHVINFDFPRTPIDYLHRTGRTARAGGKGRITNLVAKPDRVLAARIEWALSKGEALDQLSADKASAVALVGEAQGRGSPPRPSPGRLSCPRA